MYVVNANYAMPELCECYWQHEDAVALFSRVRFLRLLYAALAAIMRRDQVSMQEAERCLASCTELVCIMQNTVTRGLRPKAHKEEDPNRGHFYFAVAKCTLMS